MGLILPSSITLELWEMNALNLPVSLREAYTDLLHTVGCLQEAKTGSKEKNIHGGKTDKETMLHFTHRFGVCAGRPAFLLLDPRSKFGQISIDLQTSFTDGRISMLDIPCGCGAGITSLVTTIATLREKNILPSLPLEINVLGGDHSPKALEMFGRMIDHISPFTNSMGIRLVWQTFLWDAARSDKTAEMVDKWFTMQPLTEEFFVLVSNFSGAASRSKSFSALMPSIREISGRLYNKRNTLLWIEPSSNSALEFLSSLVAWIRDALPWLKSSGGSFTTCDYMMRHPVNSQIHPTGLSVQSYQRA